MRAVPVTMLPLHRLPFVLACSILILCGCSRTAKIDRHLARGETFFKSEQFDKAEIEYLNVLRMEATNVVALRQLGLSYYHQGRFLHAYAFLNDAARFDPANDETRVRLAGILLASRKIKEARDHADAVLLRNPSHDEALMLLAETAYQDAFQVRQRLESLRPHAESKPGFHLALGTLELRQHRTNEALANFQRALTLNPQSSPAHLALGNVFALLRDHAKADHHLKSASELAPVRSARRIQYADYKLRRGDAPAAKALLTSITRQAPDYVLPYVRLGEIALAENQFDEAATFGKKVLSRDPNHYEALLLLGRVSMARGEASTAVTQLERLVTAYPRVAHAYHQLALALLMNKNQLKAISTLHKALEIEPQHTESVLLLAELNIRKNDAGQAISALQQLVKQQPQVIQSHLLLANAYRTQREWEAAINVYENMARVFPASPQPHFLAGQVLLQQKRPADARKKFEQALELAPEYLPSLEELVDLDLQERRFSTAEKRAADYSVKYPKAAAPLLFLARVYTAQSNHLAAEQVLKRAIELDATYQPAYLALARSYVGSNKQKEAIGQLQILLSQSTNNIAAWMQLGMIHNELKNYDEAREAYERLLAVDPRFFPALNNLAYLYSERFNSLDKAYAMARAARGLRPFDPVVADTLGWILFKRGEYPWALSLLQESAYSDRMPKSAEVIFHLAMTHYMLGEEEPARSAFQRALEMNQEFPGKAEAQQRLAFLTASPASKNVAALEQQIEANPRDPVLLSRIASLHEQAGAYDKAVQAYERALRQNPKNISAMVKLAQIHAGPLKNQPRAMQIAREAHALAPDDPYVRHTVGRLAFQVGDHRWSLSLLEDTARRLGESPDVLFDLAWAAYSNGHLEQADATMRKALSKANGFGKANEAKRFVEMNAVALKPDVAEATASQIDAALKEDANYVPALFASGILQERTGQAVAAHSQYVNILKRFPLFSPAHKRLAILLSAKPETIAEAYTHATKAREALPDDVEVARTLGILSFRRGDYTRASQLLKEASRKNVQDAELFYFLGMAHYHCREKSAATEALKYALAKAPTAAFAPDIQRVLGELK